MIRTFAVALALFAAAPAFAERADRDKPVHLEADKVTIDDRKGTQVFEGRVTLTQGTMTVHGAKIVVSQDDAGYQKGVAYGDAKAPASFRQKREGKDEWIEGHAERIEHDARTEQTRLFNHAYVKSGDDEVSGQYIEYDGLTENYVVTGGPATGGQSTSSDNRVRAVIQPKNKNPQTQPAPAGDSATPPPAQAPAVATPSKE